MIRKRRHQLITFVCLLVLITMPIVAAAADSATVNTTSTPACLTPGQKVNVSVNVTNTGTETWYTSAACPPGTPHDPIPGLVNDCRHSITYWIDGVYKGDVTNLPANINPSGSATISASFCASDTTATRDCEGSNSPLSIGAHTVEWFVLHQYIGKVLTGKTDNFQVKSSCDSPFTCPDGSTGWACFCKRHHPICEPMYELPRIKRPWPPEWLKIREEILDIKSKYPAASPAEKGKFDRRIQELDQQHMPVLKNMTRELKLKGAGQDLKMKNLEEKHIVR